MEKRMGISKKEKNRSENWATRTHAHRTKHEGCVGLASFAIKGGAWIAILASCT